MNLTVDTRYDGVWTVLTVGGEVDAFSAPTLRERMADAIAAGNTRLVADLQGVTFMDSTGLGVLVGRLKAARQAGGDLRLVTADPRLLRNFSITGLDRVFTIHPDLATAVASS